MTMHYEGLQCLPWTEIEISICIVHIYSIKLVQIPDIGLHILPFNIQSEWNINIP